MSTIQNPEAFFTALIRSPFFHWLAISGTGVAAFFVGNHEGMK